jgi:hypothetical protein
MGNHQFIPEPQGHHADILSQRYPPQNQAPPRKGAAHPPRIECRPEKSHRKKRRLLAGQKRPAPRKSHDPATNETQSQADPRLPPREIRRRQQRPTPHPRRDNGFSQKIRRNPRIGVPSTNPPDQAPPPPKGPPPKGTQSGAPQKIPPPEGDPRKLVPRENPEKSGIVRVD